MLITQAMIQQARTSAGAYSKAQIKFAKMFTGAKEKQFQTMVGMEISEEDWKVFCTREGLKQRVKDKPVINAVSRPDGWAWQPEAKDIPPPRGLSKREKKAEARKKRKQRVRLREAPVQRKEFYESKEWLQLRVRVLEKYGCRCMMCGRSYRSHGVVIHVDHIKPRSKYPNLALEFSNLQILCEDCNIGKSNKYETDYRPDDILAANEIDELSILNDARARI